MSIALICVEVEVWAFLSSLFTLYSTQMQSSDNFEFRASLLGDLKG